VKIAGFFSPDVYYEVERICMNNTCKKVRGKTDTVFFRIYYLIKILDKLTVNCPVAVNNSTRVCHILYGVTV